MNQWQNQYSNAQWNGVSQHYSSTGQYSPAAYQTTMHHSNQSITPAGYESLHSPASDGGYPSPHYPNNTPYTYSNSPSSDYRVYSSVEQSSDEGDLMQGLRQPRQPRSQRAQPTHPYPDNYPVPSQPYPSQYYHPHEQSRPRSQPQVYPYDYAPQTPSPTYPAASQYPAQIPLTPVSPNPYPHASPRPFACDLCTLSFNRQHDLKRHRETHTGEKPYLCNGGCGKTFTRKDALKRHQLVKGCGKVDEPWSPSS